MNRSTAPDGQVLSVLGPQLKELERRLREDLGAGGPFLRKEGLRLLESGGKRLRPSMAIAAGHLGAYDASRVLPVAAAIEMIHMATLVHDDVIDGAPLRRGAATTFALHGAHTAVYTGDWMLVKALRALSALDDALSGRDVRSPAPGGRRATVPETLVEGLEALCAGEVDQYLGRGRLPSVKTYLSRIERKTAALFAAACAAGAAAVDLDDSVVRTCAEFGRAYGIAFQIADDLLDVGGIAAGPAGKPVAHDLVQGIATLPYLLAAKASPDYRARLEYHFREVGTPGAPARPERVLALTHEMTALGGVEAAHRVALRHLDEAEERLATLPPSVGRDMLAELSRLPLAAR